MNDIEGVIVAEAHAYATRTPGTRVVMVGEVAVALTGAEPPAGTMEAFLRTRAVWIQTARSRSCHMALLHKPSKICQLKLIACCISRLVTRVFESRPTSRPTRDTGRRSGGAA